MENIFESPTPENINKGVKVVSGFVYTIRKSFLNKKNGEKNFFSPFSHFVKATN
jgi:hypothetical protein